MDGVKRSRKRTRAPRATMKSVADLARFECVAVARPPPPRVAMQLTPSQGVV